MRGHPRTRRPTTRGRLRPAAVLSLALAALGVGCSEEDRRAWVSILPGGEPESGETADPADRSGPIALADDSTAVLLGADTLFTVERLARGAGGRLRSLTPSPDSTLVAVVHVAGGAEAVEIWSRIQQLSARVQRFSGGVDTLAWSPSGRFLAYGGREGDRTTVGLYDTGIGARIRSPVVEWLGRSGRAIRFVEWAEGDRARVLVAPGADAAAGLAHLWDGPAATFVVESMAEAVAATAERIGVRGGAHSVDLIGDPAPETILFYRSPDGAPGAVVFESRADELRGRPTAPLLPVDALGFGKWEETPGMAGLRMIAELGGEPVLVVDLPSSRAPLSAVGLFRATRDRGVEPIDVEIDGETRPAILFDGQLPYETTQFGFVDLDGDGGFEVATAIGVVEEDPPTTTIRWRASVLRWAGDRLVPAPDLERAALDHIQRVTGAGGDGDEISESAEPVEADEG